MGVILWEGASRIDGAPLVLLGTGRDDFRKGRKGKGSANGKTGAMLQTWILRADVAPHHARAAALDVSICGGCPHAGRIVPDASSPSGRRREDVTCYVAAWQGPRATWASYANGDAERADSAADREAWGAGHMVRLGSYGDPMAIPYHVWVDVLSLSVGRTGYTHQWRSARLRGEDPWHTIVMASCDSPRDVSDASALGFGTFHVVPVGSPLPARERLCPASEEAGRVTTCEDCGACDGRKRQHIVIPAHGSRRRLVTIGRALRVPV